MLNIDKIEHYYTIEELSKYLQIPINTLYRYTMKKKIPCFKVGRRVRFSKESIDSWVKVQEKKYKHSKKRKRRKCI